MIGAHLYSVRMRASAAGRHVSGAERLVPAPQLALAVQEIVQRAVGKGIPVGQIIVTIDAIAPDEIQLVQALHLVSSPEADVPSARARARAILESVGVASVAVQAAMQALDKGPSRSGGNMRGAMIMDARTGERLEPDQERGIRASRFDWSEDAAAVVRERLAELGLTHLRTQEALALASKVAQAPGIIAELCWSDDPDYLPGYVAGPGIGYIRFPALKLKGTARGGRAFFVDRSSWSLEPSQRYLQRTPVLLSVPGSMRAIGADQGTIG